MNIFTRNQDFPSLPTCTKNSDTLQDIELLQLAYHLAKTSSKSSTAPENNGIGSPTKKGRWKGLLLDKWI